MPINQKFSLTRTTPQILQPMSDVQNRNDENNGSNERRFWGWESHPGGGPTPTFGSATYYVFGIGVTHTGFLDAA